MTATPRTVSLFALALSTTLSLGLTAQTHTLRGGVEDVRNTQNQFYLDCTSIPIVSSTINLNLWTNTDATMQVKNVGTAQAPVLQVDSIAATPKIFDMGNLRFGEAKTWEVNAPVGAFAMVFVDFPWNTGFRPYGAMGSWVLGPAPVSFRSGFSGAGNQFQFQFTMPNLPQYTGLELVGQALVVDGGTWALSNPDCRVVGN
ncbi:MAG: hypothetical protein NXI31_07075 [bacterium]|nr:hypothetical protein [bacterium]